MMGDLLKVVTVIANKPAPAPAPYPAHYATPHYMAGPGPSSGFTYQGHTAQGSAGEYYSNGPK